MRPKWTAENKPLKDIKPYFKNPRKITGKKLQDLEQSLDKFGLAGVITLNLDGTIIGGHARYYSLIRAGEKQALCIIPDRLLTEVEVDELNIRLNKNIAGEWDVDMLANQFDVDDLKGWGFDEFELGGAIRDDDDEEDDEETKSTKGKDKKVECPECGTEFVP